MGVEQAADPQPPSPQQELFAEDNTAPRFVEIDRTRVRVENCRQFGGPWLALELVKRLGLHEFLRRTMPKGQEQVPWSLTALILVIARLCEPSRNSISPSISTGRAPWAICWVCRWTRWTTTAYTAGWTSCCRTSRAGSVSQAAVRRVVRHRVRPAAVRRDQHIFRGPGQRESPGQRGCLRDHRSDCKQVCIGLVVTALRPAAGL